jgi:hypothetical protein
MTPGARSIDDLEPTLVDVLDRLLDHGVVVSGEARISIAGVDLVFLGLEVVLSSVDTIERARRVAIEDRT